MARTKTQFVCQQCNYETPSWLGKCPNCGEWNSLVETIVSTRKEKGKREKGKVASLLRLSEIKKEKLSRIFTGIGEFDRVLGGGIVPGSVVLLAGDPGIGKSTIMLQLAEALTKQRNNRITKQQKHQTTRQPNNRIPKKQKNSYLVDKLLSCSVLYVSGEESAEQLKLRAERLKIKGEDLLILEETNVEEIVESIRRWEVREKLSLIIIDSIQTLYSEELTGIPGSIGQVRTCVTKLFDTAKKARIPMFLIGHITKEGTIAGPKTIEHLVDTVLYLEGDRTSFLRILRSFKNRFGPTDEVGVFQMGQKGLEEVTNPSRAFLGEKREVPGSAVTVTIQGIRPILTEIESLVVPTKLPFPRRVTSGVSFSRLQIICAVVIKLLRLPLGGFDIYTSVSGGLKLTEPGVDLAITLSIISSFKNKPLPVKTAAIGELGLLGEIRKVPFLEKREKEAQKLGFKKILGYKTYRDLPTLVKKIWP